MKFMYYVGNQLATDCPGHNIPCEQCKHFSGTLSFQFGQLAVWLTELTS